MEDREKLEHRYKNLSGALGGRLARTPAKIVYGVLEDYEGDVIESGEVMRQSGNPLLRNLGPQNAGTTLSALENLGFLEEANINDNHAAEYVETDQAYSGRYCGEDGLRWDNIREDLLEVAD